jgi:large subunit ribosomal protein L21
MYAIVDIKSKQFKVSEGDTLYVPYQKDLDPGTEVTYDDVLLVSNGGDVRIGEPVVGEASIQARVLDHVKDDKVTVFKFKKRKRYRIKRGHRQPYTQIEIESLTVGEAPEPAVREEEPVEEEPVEEEPIDEALEEEPVEEAPTEEEVPAEEEVPEEEVVEDEAEETEAELEEPEPAAEEEAEETAEEETAEEETAEEETVEDIEALLDAAVEKGVIERAGSWYKYEGETLGQGKSAAAEHLEEHPDVLAEVQDKVQR